MGNYYSDLYITGRAFNGTGVDAVAFAVGGCESGGL
jgi:hypothetical protein